MTRLIFLNDEFEERILEWLNDSVVCQWNSHGIFPVTETHKSDKNTLRFGIFEDKEIPRVKPIDRLYGVIALQNIDWVNRSAELAILIGKTSEHRRGHGKAAAAMICYQGFSNLNLHRIYCGTHEKNIGMQKVAESVGMQLEGRTRQAFYKHGEYADILHYGVLKEEFHAHFSHIERSGDQPADHPGGGKKAP